MVFGGFGAEGCVLYYLVFVLCCAFWGLEGNVFVFLFVVFLEGGPKANVSGK